MATEKDFYIKNHYQLARIDTYQMQRMVVIGWIVAGCASLASGALLHKTALSIFGLFAFLFLGMKLWAKHRMLCPKCGEQFFGAFNLLMPFTQHCKKCGISYYPEHDAVE